MFSSSANLFSSSTRRDFLSLDFSIEIFQERSLPLYLTNSHFMMGSSKDEALFKKFGIAFSLLLQTLCLASMSCQISNSLDLLPLDLLQMFNFKAE